MFSIILLNGPKESGKDTLARLVNERADYVHMEFKARLYEIGAKMAGLPLGDYIWLCVDRSAKEAPTPLLGGKSPREHLIWVSEGVIKPLCGEGYFGLHLADKVAFEIDMFGEGAVVSDSGFLEELIPIVGLDESYHVNVHVVRLHKEGCSFAGDSRDYLTGDKIKSDCLTFHDLTVVDGDIEGTYEALESLVGGF